MYQPCQWSNKVRSSRGTAIAKNDRDRRLSVRSSVSLTSRIFWASKSKPRGGAKFVYPSIAPHDDGPLGDRMADDDAIRHVGILRDELLGGVFRREYEQGCASVGS